MMESMILEGFSSLRGSGILCSRMVPHKALQTLSLHHQQHLSTEVGTAQSPKPPHFPSLPARNKQPQLSPRHSSQSLLRGRKTRLQPPVPDSNLPSPARRGGAELGVPRGTSPRERSWNPPGRGAVLTHLALCHHVQVLVVDGEGHVPQHRAAVLEHRHHLVLDPALGGAVRPDLRGENDTSEGPHSSQIPPSSRGWWGQGRRRRRARWGKELIQKSRLRACGSRGWSKSSVSRIFCCSRGFARSGEIMREFCGCR